MFVQQAPSFQADASSVAGLWKLSIQLPESYPLAPPDIRFETPICHPNVHFKVPRGMSAYPHCSY